MTDERFERDLIDALRGIAGQEAPMSLRYRLSDISDRPPIAHRLWFAGPLRVSVVAVVATAVLALAILVWPSPDVGPALSESPSPTTSQAASPTQGQSPSYEPGAEPVEPTPVPTPMPTTGPSGEWTGLAWSDPVTPPLTVHLEDLLPRGDGYVAVGRVDVGGGVSEAAFFVSEDGLNWTVEDQLDAGAGGFPQHLVALGDELLAFSEPNLDALGLPNAGEPLIWRSTDGTDWTPVDSSSWRSAWSGLWIGPMPASWDTTQHDPETGLVDVASGPGGLVAIGNSFAEEEMIPVVLHSTDGRTWDRIPLPPGSAGASLSSVVSRGRFVVVGAVAVGPDEATAVPAAWISGDGTTWSAARVPTDGVLPDGAGGEFGPLVAGRDGLLTCMGWREMSAGAHRFIVPWTSTDGSTWEVAMDRDASPACAWSAADGERIVALGPRPLPTGTDSPGVTMAWTSTDGVTWESLSLGSTLQDRLERFWVVPDGVIYAGVESFWFGTPSTSR